MGLTQKQKETLKQNNERSNCVTREAIWGALYILMQTEDFNKIKITDIIRRAGVSRSAFYRNYKTKEEILYDVVKSIQDILIKGATNSLPGSWKWTFSFLRPYKKQLDIIIQAGLEHYLLDTINQSLDYESGQDFKNAMYNGLMYNVILYWVKSGMQETDEETANLILKSYREIVSDVETYS